MLAASAVDVGASSLITVFKPSVNHLYYYKGIQYKIFINKYKCTMDQELWTELLVGGPPDAAAYVAVGTGKMLHVQLCTHQTAAHFCVK